MIHRKIMSVINEHTVSTVIARYAISMASACNAELELYAVHDESGNETTRHNTDNHFEQIYTAASELDVSVSRKVEFGTIGTLLPKRIEVGKADLVFYPLTPYNRFSAVQQRQTIHHLLKTIRVDLAIMRAVSMAMPHPGNVLVPLGKVVSDKERRMKFVAGLARSFNAPVTLYHQTEEHGNHENHELSADIAAMRSGLELRHITVKELYGRGDIGKTITAEAITHRNDLTVLGLSGCGVLRRLFFGNPGGGVMYHPPCNTIMFQAAL
jgi:nucleotide-binding universal stress UspA family protein